MLLLKVKEVQTVEDHQIIELYWQRSETAIQETQYKYGPYCRAIAQRILSSAEDSEECVNDTYLSAWNTIPPHRPIPLSAFLGRITRNLALNRYKRDHTQMRTPDQVPLVLDELHECIPAPGSTDRLIDELVLTDLLNRFLGELSKENRMIFMRRYWYLTPVYRIAADFSISESKVKISLYRSRRKLKELLQKEGYML